MSSLLPAFFQRSRAEGLARNCPQRKDPRAENVGAGLQPELRSSGREGCQFRLTPTNPCFSSGLSSYRACAPLAFKRAPLVHPEKGSGILITNLLLRWRRELFDLCLGSTFEFQLPNREPTPANYARPSRGESFLGLGLTQDTRDWEGQPAEGSGLLWCGEGEDADKPRWRRRRRWRPRRLGGNCSGEGCRSWEAAAEFGRNGAGLRGGSSSVSLSLSERGTQHAPLALGGRRPPRLGPSLRAVPRFHTAVSAMSP